MNEFFLLKEIESLNKAETAISIDGKDLNLYLALTHCTVDLVAKPEVQQIVQFNCTYCFHPGEQIENKFTKKKQQ